MAEPLHFDTDAWSHLVSRINAHADECKGKLDVLTLYVEDLTGGEWKAPAALEFKADFENWSKKEYRYYENLVDLNRRLTREIDQWLDTAGRLEA